MSQPNQPHPPKNQQTNANIAAIAYLYDNTAFDLVKAITSGQVLLSDEKIKNQVPTAIFPETSSKLACPALVTALSSRLDLAVSIDNGVMHMMSLSNIPMIVLFGPTNSNKFAPKNDFTKVLDSKKIHNTSNIESITVEEVYELI